MKVKESKILKSDSLVKKKKNILSIYRIDNINNDNNIFYKRCSID